jgi:hypothetical protein
MLRGLVALVMSVALAVPGATFASAPAASACNSHALTSDGPSEALATRDAVDHHAAAIHVDNEGADSAAGGCVSGHCALCAALPVTPCVPIEGAPGSTPAPAPAARHVDRFPAPETPPPIA